MKNSKFTLLEDLGESVLIETNDEELLTLLENDQYIKIAGYGKCRACSCSGFTPGKNSAYCTCRHHISQHGS